MGEMIPVSMDDWASTAKDDYHRRVVLLWVRFYTLKTMQIYEDYGESRKAWRCVQQSYFLRTAVINAGTYGMSSSFLNLLHSIQCIESICNVLNTSD